MRILYFLEPRKELGQPLFRLGSVRNHISKELQQLKSLGSKRCDVRLLTSVQIAKAAKQEGLLEGIEVHTIEQADIERYFEDSERIARDWYKGSYSDLDKTLMQELCLKALGVFKPDIIVSYESAAPYLQCLYPDSAFLNSTLGMFSRAPFPELGCFDPFGVYKDSYIRKFEKELRELELDITQHTRLHRLRAACSDFIDNNNPIISNDIRGGFDKVLLVPLQVSGYFAFDDNLPDEIEIKNQLDLVKYILEQVSSSIGVYVTLHGAEDKVMTHDTVMELKSLYPNLLYNPNVQKVRWCSQWVMPYVDGVATVSSSVGLQAVFWKKPVFSIGDSHVASFNAGDLKNAHEILGREHCFDGAVYHLLKSYYPLMSNKVQNGEWLYSFLEMAICNYQNNSLDFGCFDTKECEDTLFNDLTSNIQTCKAYEELQRFSSHMTSKKKVDVAQVKNKIDKHDVISFDIFDTLITRKLVNPNHVFDLIGLKSKSVFIEQGISLSQFGGFRNLRERAADRVKKKVDSTGGEEITLIDIYSEIRQLTRLPEVSIKKLYDLELSVEHQVMSVRQLGYELFEYSRDQGKKIILVSDMYLPQDAVEELVKAKGYHEFEQCFVSSEYNKLKKTGSLYQIVKNKFSGSAILHLGDNHLSDVLKANEAGISAVHLPLINDSYMASRLAKDILTKEEINETLGTSLMHGVISREFYDNEENTSNWFRGAPYRMGFEAGGPILLSFAKWILEEAVRDGVEDLYFLARDGYLVKKIFDQVSKNYPNSPKAHYLLASRRCYSTANLRTEQDIFDSLSLKFSRTPLYKILESRFGICEEEVNLDTLKQSGIKDLSETIDISRNSQLNKFKRFLSLNKSLILDKAKEERECLLEYLSSNGPNKERRCAVVDIGHNASLQAALSILLNQDKSIGGYYFMTFYGAKNLYDQGAPIKGYLANFEDNRLSSHPYCKNIGMFEFLFLPAIPSFKRFTKVNGELIAEYVSGDESARFSVIDLVHKGCLDYCHKVLDIIGDQISAYDVSSVRAIKTYIEFTKSPYRDDVIMFDKLSFVDQFGGNDSRYLIATPNYKTITADNYSCFLRDSWWREGAEVLINGTGHNRINIASKVGCSPATNNHLNERSLSILQRKMRKLRNNPKSFFIDSFIWKALKSSISSRP